MGARSRTDTGRTVLVTGASSGIGREVALRLAREGVPVALLARRQQELDQAEKECFLAGSPRTVVVSADVSDPSAIDDAFRHAAAELGAIDSVVHAAGVAAYGRFEEIPPELFDRVQSVNVAGTANVARAAIRHFDGYGIRGDLVLVGSVVGRISAPFLSPYVASKWAVHGLARSLQAEQGSQGHRIGLLGPGGVDTSIYQKAASYLGVQGKPPPPVDDVATVADAAIALLRGSRKQRSVGALNGIMSLGFRALPAVYDVLAAPLMRRLALDDAPVGSHDGNAFVPLPEPAGSSGSSR